MSIDSTGRKNTHWWNCCTTDCSDAIDTLPTRCAEVGCLSGIGCAVGAAALGLPAWVTATFLGNTVVHAVSEWKLRGNHSREKLAAASQAVAIQAAAGTATIASLVVERQQGRKEEQKEVTAIHEASEQEKKLQSELDGLVARMEKLNQDQSEGVVRAEELEAIAAQIAELSKKSLVAKQQLDACAKVATFVAKASLQIHQDNQQLKQALEESKKQQEQFQRQLSDLAKIKVNTDAVSGVTHAATQLERDTASEGQQLADLRATLAQIQVDAEK